MNRFQDGTWGFHAEVDPSPKQWEVTYFYHIGNREARKCFHAEEEAQKFANATGGKCRKVEPRGRYK